MKKLWVFVKLFFMTIEMLPSILGMCFFVGGRVVFNDDFRKQFFTDISFRDHLIVDWMQKGKWVNVMFWVFLLLLIIGNATKGG